MKWYHSVAIIMHIQREMQHSSRLTLAITRDGFIRTTFEAKYDATQERIQAKDLGIYP